MTQAVLLLMVISVLLNSQGISKYIPSSFKIKKSPVNSITVSAAFFHGSRDEKRIALTFDACATVPRSRYDSNVVRILLETKTPATMFLCGKWAIEHQKETRFLSEQQLFEIGNHSFIHPRLSTVSVVRLKEELLLTQNVIYTVIGKIPTLFRPPYGEQSDTVMQCASSLGLRTVQYDLASGDPDSSVSTKRLITYVSSRAKNGSIIVMHMNKRGWHTADALPEIIGRLRKRGFIFVKVSELLQ